MLDAEKIKHALNEIHKVERSSTNPSGVTRVAAIENLLRGTKHKLTHAEVDVLLRALHVSRIELSVQW